MTGLRTDQLSERGQQILLGTQRTPGVLLASNFSNRTGYAWNNIHRLFGALAKEFHARGYATWVSFNELESPVELGIGNSVDGYVEFPSSPSRFRELPAWLSTFRRLGIRIAYFTDHASAHYRFALLRLVGVKKIIVHNRISVADPHRAPPERGLRGALKWLSVRLPFCAADRVYAVSDFVRDRLVHKARFPAGRVLTILNGVDLEQFSPVDREPQGLPVTIFCGGRASLHKGIDVLIEAAALLHWQKGLPEFQVCYAGDGPEMARLQQLARDRGLGESFKFLGRVESTASLVRDADIVVVPSTWGDACPSTIAEALACGKALVATRVGGVPEQVGDPPAAILIEPRDAGALAEAIAALALDPGRRAELERSARARAEAALDQRRYHRKVIDQLLRDCGIG
jgi:glycosyltransferase involved in cell wall biosynthesis